MLSLGTLIASRIKKTLLKHTDVSVKSQRRDPLVMWLAGLHIPESYLTALVQTACRKQGWPLDRSTLYTSVTAFTHEDQVEARPEMVSTCIHMPSLNNINSLGTVFILF